MRDIPNIAEEQIAYRNVLDSLRTDIYLPENVFVGHWEAFYFFESDQVFRQSFADFVSGLMSLEGSTTTCLVNLIDANSGKDASESTEFFDIVALHNEYAQRLRKDRLGKVAWMFGVERYGCASTSGKWAVYCEKEEDLAVIGFRSLGDAAAVSASLSAIFAFSIENHIAKGGKSAAFPIEALKPEWSGRILENYGN